MHHTVQRHRGPRAFAQEVRALTRWTRRLPAPRLVAADDGVVVMTRCPGTPPRADDPKVHQLAGAWLAALHTVPAVDEDPVSVGEALQKRVDAAVRAAHDDVPAAVVRDCVALRDALPTGVRVPCHRDFTPDNWLVHAGRLYVVDFEHARLDHPLMDMVKLYTEVWPAAPGCREAFIRGYGQELDEPALDALAALHRLQTWSWALKHQDAPRVRLARAMLRPTGATPAGSSHRCS